MCHPERRTHLLEASTHLREGIWGGANIPADSGAKPVLRLTFPKHVLSAAGAAHEGSSTHSVT